MKVLLVEDDTLLNTVIAKGLRKYGYAVDCAFDGEEAVALYEVNCYDLIVLDLNLPKIDGIDVLKEIRTDDFDTKIIILSARSEVEDKVFGLDMGANDYLEKPFDFFELDARIRNLLRRSFTQKSTILSCGPIQIDTAKRHVIAGGELLELTNKEYALLEYLLHNEGKVVSAETLIEHIWESDVDLFSNSLKYHVHSLRRKLAAQIGNHELIQTRRGQGYLISDQEEEGNDQ